VGPCLIHTCHAAPVQRHDHVLKATSQGHGTARHVAAWIWHVMIELASAVQRRHVGDLPAFGFFRLPRGVPRRLLSEAYQSVKLWDFPATKRTSTEDTALSENGSGEAWHGRATAWVRHGMCELAFRDFHQSLTLCKLITG
jgi:hypothetical protein